MPSLLRSESARKKQLKMAVRIGLLMSISHVTYAEETANNIEDDQNKNENIATVSSTVQGSSLSTVPATRHSPTYIKSFLKAHVTWSPVDIPQAAQIYLVERVINNNCLSQNFVLVPLVVAGIDSSC